MDTGMRILNGDHAEFEREHANTPLKDRPDWPLPSFDARDWAKAFLDKNPECGLGEDTMIGWFANALMRGYDQRKPRSPNMIEMEHAVQAATAEINNLRRRNEVLQAKADTVEIFGMALQANARNHGIGMGEDPVWRLERALRAFGEAPAATNEAKPAPPANTALA